MCSSWKESVGRTTEACLTDYSALKKRVEATTVDIDIMDECDEPEFDHMVIDPLDYNDC